MDVVGSVASLSQLAVYMHCTIENLRHLYRVLTDAKFQARSQLDELHVLLKILSRIEKDHSSLDTELLIPVLLSISTIVQKLKNWLHASSTVRLRWNLVVHKIDIEEAFKLLRRKYNLLIFYYSKQNNYALSRIESILKAHFHVASGSPESMSDTQTQSVQASKDEAQPERTPIDLAPDRRRPRHESQTLSNANSTSAQHAPGLETNRPPDGMQSEQSPVQEAQNSSSKEGRMNQEIQASGNTHVAANFNGFQNWYHENSNFQGRWDNNTIQGGTTNFGNNEEHHSNTKA